MIPKPVCLPVLKFALCLGQNTVTFSTRSSPTCGFIVASAPLLFQPIRHGEILRHISVRQYFGTVHYSKLCYKKSCLASWTNERKCLFINSKTGMSTDVKSNVFAKLVKMSPASLQPYMRLMRLDRPIGV
jgi:hypothetical protein